MTKFCKDCEFFATATDQVGLAQLKFGRCLKSPVEVNRQFEIVTGVREVPDVNERFNHAVFARKEHQPCGPAGKNFQARPPL